MNFFDYTSLDDPILHGLTLFERVLPILILIIILFVLIKYKNSILKTRVFDIILASMMLLGELSYMLWNLYHSQYDRVDFFSTLPFHLCSYAIWGTLFSLYANNYKIFKLIFPFSIISVLALFFPNLNHGFNSFRYYQLFYSHSLILISFIYIYTVKGIKPIKKDFVMSFITLHVIIVVSLITNIIMKSDFLYIGPGNKPIDFAWDWPYHMIQYEAVMVLFYLGMYYYLKKILKQKMD